MMLQKIKIETFDTSHSFEEKTVFKKIDWARMLFILQCIVLLAIPLIVLSLSLANENLFIREILTVSILMVLILIIKIAGERSKFQSH